MYRFSFWTVNNYWFNFFNRYRPIQMSVSSYVSFVRLCLSKNWAISSFLFCGHESESEVAQSCLSLCDPMDSSPPFSSDHGILQARMLEWVAISFSRGSSRPRDRTRVSCIIGRHFTVWTIPFNVLFPFISDISNLYSFYLNVLEACWFYWSYQRISFWFRLFFLLVSYFQYHLFLLSYYFFTSPYINLLLFV